jgi:hypothetical protein
MRHHFTTQLPHRSAECTITESLDTIYINISCSNYDDLHEDTDYLLWLFPIISRYENDKRQVIVTSPNSDLVGVLEVGADN